MDLCFSGRVVEEQWSLMELGVRPQGSTRMEMSSTDPATHPLRPLRPPEQDNMPDVITVRVQTGEDTFCSPLGFISYQLTSYVTLSHFKDFLYAV